jgi:hypothetical protein
VRQWCALTEPDWLAPESRGRSTITEVPFYGNSWGKTATKTFSAFRKKQKHAHEIARSQSAKHVQSIRRQEVPCTLSLVLYQGATLMIAKERPMEARSDA